MSKPDALTIKTFGPLEVKDSDKGIVMAEVASLDVVDHDKEVIREKAIQGEAKVKLSFYGHNAVTNGEAPVGKGTIRSVNGKAVLMANYFMSTSRGREAFETVKALGEDGEWSVGFRVVKWSEPDDEWKAKGAVRMLDEIELLEVSPVLRGASPNTSTIGVKALDGTPEPVAEPVAEPVVEAEPPVVDPPADEVTPADDAATKAAAEVALQLKAQRDEAMEEYHRVQRALGRMGYA